MAVPQKESLAFLYERGRDPRRVFTSLEVQLLGRAGAAFDNAGALVLRLGGKAGRLGECIVATALLEGCLQALAHSGKVGTPVSIIVDETASELFKPVAYEDAYWRDIKIIPAPADELLEASDWQRVALPGTPAILLDLHGAHDGAPYLQQPAETAPWDGNLAFMHLYRAGIRFYARHGPLHRYADFVQDLLQVKPGVVDAKLVQPTIRLGSWDEDRYRALAHMVGWPDDSFRIIGFFQSVVAAKCYGRWGEVLEELSALVARHWPNRAIHCLIAAGPSRQQPNGANAEELASLFSGFTGTQHNTTVRVEQIDSLHDLALLIARCSLVLSNDTGPGHLAGALSIPTITPFLPGGVYSMEVWASSLWHHGVTLEPNPFTTAELEQAVLWEDATLIDRIEPSRLADAAFRALAGPRK